MEGAAAAAGSGPAAPGAAAPATTATTTTTGAEETKDNNGSGISTSLSASASTSTSSEGSSSLLPPPIERQYSSSPLSAHQPLQAPPSISPSPSTTSLADATNAAAGGGGGGGGGYPTPPIRRSHSLTNGSMRPPLPPPSLSSLSHSDLGDDRPPSARPSAPPTPRDGDNSFHRSLSNTLPRPADVDQRGPLPCFEAIEESQLLESLYSFQQQRAQQEREQQQKRRDGEKGPGINLEKVARLLGPTAGSGRTVRLLGGGLFDLEKGMNGGSTKTGCKSQDGGAGEGEPMLGVASPFVRLRDGRIVPLRTLNEEQGDFVCLTHFPKPQEEDNPNLRLARVLPYIRGLMPTFLTRMRHQTWKIMKGIVWFLSLIWWQILLGIFFSTLAYEKNHLMNLQNANTDKLHTELKDMHRLFGSVLAFIIAFRTNNAYQSYVEGRKEIGKLMAAIRELTLEVYTALPKGHPGPAMDFASELPPSEDFEPRTLEERQMLDQEEAYLKAAAREVRRLCHLAFAFIRQDVREAHYGFLPGSDLENVPFTAKNFYLDPCRPRLWDLMSEDELTRYARVPIRARPGCVIGDIKLILEMMALRVESKTFLNVVTPLVRQILDSHQGMSRIRDTPVPFPFLFIINLCVFVFVFSTPFLYYRTGTVGILFAEMLLTFAYYGLLAIGLTIENPFAFHFGGFNLEVERFSRICHEDTLQWAMDIAGDTTSFIPAYLVDEGARDTPVSAAAAKAAQLEQEEMQEMQTAAAAARGDGRGEESDEDDDDEERGYCVGRKDSFCAMISRIPTPQDLPTPKHLPLPPTPEGVPATAIVAIDENSQPVLVIPPPPTVRQPKQKRWMKIEGQ